jgi:hypothetical protein
VRISTRSASLSSGSGREKQLELVLKASEGINGDLQAIAGRTLDAIDALQPQMMLLPDEN